MQHYYTTSFQINLFVFSITFPTFFLQSQLRAKNIRKKNSNHSNEIYRSEKKFFLQIYHITKLYSTH